MLHLIFGRSLSLLAAVSAIVVIVYETIQISSGTLYLQSLNYIDGTTLIGLAIITLWGTYTLRDQTDLQAVSATLVNALSFIFAYEALYKWSFFLAPFRMQMPAAELREFVIQAGIALTALTGFADGRFTLKRWTFIWLAFFVILWSFWLSVGFPQLTGKLAFAPMLPIEFTQVMTYSLNRATKAVLFFIYLSFFPVK